MLTVDGSRAMAVARPELARLAARTARAYPDLPAPIVLRWSDEPVLVLDRGSAMVVRTDRA